MESHAFDSVLSSQDHQEEAEEDEMEEEDEQVSVLEGLLSEYLIVSLALGWVCG